MKISSGRSITGKSRLRFATFAVVAIMLFSSIAVFVSISGVLDQNMHNFPVSSYNNSVNSPIFSEAKLPVPVTPNSVSYAGHLNYTGNANVLVTFKLSNQSELDQFLSELSNPASPNYHKYITRQQFEQRFGPTNSTYNSAIKYFESFTGLKVTTYSDHVSLLVKGPASQIGQAFNTSLETIGKGTYAASSNPLLPASLASSVSLISGLSNSHLNLSLNLVKQSQSPASYSNLVTSNGYPTPTPLAIYGSNMQVAYNEQSLFNVTYPTKEVIATILWAGTNSSNQNVGPFYPSDIYSYYNQSLPSYEPHSKVYGVPLNGAVKPGFSASYNTSGITVENTLDLEMIGSTAPGSSIYNVYGPNATYVSLDAAFAYILNPNSTYSSLNNVSVISNSWGGPEFNNTAWYTYLQEAQTRGITVLASSGDSGDTQGTPYTNFPSSMAYNNFGVTAVGGTTVTLTSASNLVSQTAWYESANWTLTPVGSTGGISTVFPEPSWQLNSLANSVLNGAGRGVPDIAALANDTVIYLTTTTASTSSSLVTVAGTSVASPMEAGIVAEMNAILNKYNQSNLGYLNPLIYKLADMQFSGFTNTSTTGYIPTGTYNSSLPITPFDNVDTGRNHIFHAVYPYNLVTGWGSIDAYNFTNLVLDTNFSDQSGKLDGVQNNLTLSGIGVTSYYQTSTGVAGPNVNTYYNASIQQNFMVSDELGAPIYWVQNVIYVNGSASQGWAMNYTGWVVLPFYGQYPSQTVYEYNFPLSGKIINLPHSFDVKSWISGSGINAVMNFQVNSQVLQIPVPGAAYIISGSNYTYSWNGQTYYNGPYPDNTYPGGLTPQFGLVGGPSFGIGEFQASTSGSMYAAVRPMGFSSYFNASTSTYTYSADQTGESAANLQWTQSSANSWTLSYLNGGTTQGILSYVPNGYNVSILARGLPTASTWIVNLSSGLSLQVNSNETSFTLPDGNYLINVTGPTGYAAFPSTAILMVNGTSTQISVQFVPVANESLLTPLSSIDMNTSIVYNGVAQAYSNTLTPGSTSIVLDNRTNEMFALNLGNDSIVAYNLTNYDLVGAVRYNPTYDLFSLFYDYQTNYVYALGTNGMVIELNSTTLTGVNSVDVSSVGGGYLGTITAGENLSQLLIVSNNGNLVTLNASTLTPLIQTGIAGPLSLSGPFSAFFPSTFLSGDKLFAADYGGNQVIVLNLSSRLYSNISMPSQYGPLTLNQIGSSDILYVGGLNYSDVLLNTTTEAISVGLEMNGLAQSSASNPYNQYQYFSVVSNPLTTPNQTIDIVNISSMTIVANMPGSLVNYNLIYDKTNNLVYTSSFIYGTILVYQPQEVKYSVTFSISQEVTNSGATWYANLSNGDHSGPLTQSTYSFDLLNGTYSYTIASSDRNFNSQNGTFVVSGSNLNILGNLTEPKYGVTFVETGLPVGTAWTLVFSGHTYSSNSTNYSTISLFVPNGTYSYYVENLTGYYSNLWSSQTLTINGIGKNVSVEYIKYSAITGIVSPAGATVYVNGVAYHPDSNGTYTVELKAGNYSLVVSETGYVTQYGNVTLNAGETVHLNFTLKANSQPGGPGFSGLGNNELLIYAVLGVAAIGLLGVVIYFLRKRP